MGSQPNILVKFVLAEKAICPNYATEGSAGMDLHAYLPDGDTVIIPPGCTHLVRTGVTAEIQQGLELQIRPRSGLALNKQITVLNTPGTIDSDYRGEIGVILINHNRHDPFVVRHGDRIAQAVLGYALKARIEITTPEEFTATARGAGGFGSTGVQQSPNPA